MDIGKLGDVGCGYYGEVSIVMGVSPNGWFRVENPNLTWMMTGGTPVLGNLRVVAM